MKDLQFEKLFENILSILDGESDDYSLSPMELEKARLWIVEAEFIDRETQQPVTLERVKQESDEYISDFIENNYDGGIEAFKLSIKENLNLKNNLQTIQEAGRCTGPTQKASSDRKGKKWMKCVKSGSGYKRVHWGQKGVRVTGKSGNSKRKKSFRARHKCSSAKPGTPRYQACKDW